MIFKILSYVENWPAQKQSQSPPDAIDEILEVEDQELLLSLHGGLLGHQVEGGGEVGRPGDGLLLQLEINLVFSLVELLHCCALIGRELQSDEIFSCTERSY